MVVASSLITEVSLEGVLQRVVEIAAEVIGARYAAIGVLALDGRLLESFTTYGIDAELRAKIGPPPRGHGILGLVTGQPGRSGYPTRPTRTATDPATPSTITLSRRAERRETRGFRPPVPDREAGW